MLKYFLIAKIHSIPDNSGRVVIKSFSDFPDRFNDLENVFVDVFGDLHRLSIEKVEKFNSNITLKFKNFNSGSDVKFLLDCDIFIEENQAVQLDDDEYFIHDLIGCEVFNGKTFFGKIVNVLTFPANDVYVIDDINNEERLIPVIKNNIESIDINKKVIVLKVDGDWRYEDED